MKIVKDWLQQMLGRLFRPISREHALQIAAQALARPTDAEALFCHDTKPQRFCIYQSSSEPCWYIVAPWDDQKEGEVALRSRRVILVGKLTGMIHYDGSAHDEG